MLISNAWAARTLATLVVIGPATVCCRFHTYHAETHANTKSSPLTAANGAVSRVINLEFIDPSSDQNLDSFPSAVQFLTAPSKPVWVDSGTGP
jgi:hypothetical protein